MTTLRTLASTTQVVGLWTELMHCLYNKNSYAGSTCEIYIYTMMPYSPHFSRNKDGEWAKEDCREACKDIYHVVEQFCASLDACVVLEEGDISTLLDQEPYNHRIHFHVTKKRPVIKEVSNHG